MNLKELLEWKSKGFREELKRSHTFPCEVDGVSFRLETAVAVLSFRYKNSTGLIYPDNGFRGHLPSGDDYYPLAALSCRFDDQRKYNPSVEPNLKAIAGAVINSWELFISGK